MFTIAKRKEYSSTILSKIDSLDNDKKGIEKKKTSVVSDYDDTSSDDYTNRQTFFDSQNAYKGMVNELYNLYGYTFNKSSVLYPYLYNSSINISEYATDYSTIYSDSNYEYREDCSKMFNLLYKWTSDRSTSDLYDPDKVFASTKIQPDDQTESKNPVSLDGVDEADVGKQMIVKSDNSCSYESIYYNLINMMNTYVEYKDRSFISSGMNYTDSSSYKILLEEPEALPLTFKCYNSSASFSTNEIRYSYTDTSSSNKYDKCVMTLPQEGKTVICANSAGDFGQLFEVTDSVCKAWTDTSTSTSSNGTVSYSYTHNFSMYATVKKVSDIKNYYITGTATTEKDNTLYFWSSNYAGILYDITDSIRMKLKNAAEKCYSAYTSTPDSAKIQDEDPSTNYKSIIESLGAKKITDMNTFSWLRSYAMRMQSVFIKKRIEVLKESAADSTYSKPMIDSILSRMNKDDGTLLQWYQTDCLNNDTMYKKWTKNISNSKPYFLKLGVLKAKVSPGQQCFHTKNSDGSDTVTVDTYSNYAASKGSGDEIKEWKANNPEDIKSSYWIYVAGSFSEYYTKNGINPELKVGDTIYILDDVKTEMSAYIKSIVEDKIPSGANINSSESDSTIETTYEKVLRIECSNIVPTDYSLDNNLRIVKML